MIQYVNTRLLIEAENIVNSRPHSHLPVDAGFESPLKMTPGLDAELPKEDSTREQWRKEVGPEVSGYACSPQEVEAKNGAHPPGRCDPALVQGHRGGDLQQSRLSCQTR